MMNGCAKQFALWAFSLASIGCSQSKYYHALLNDDTLTARLDERISIGMPVEEVKVILVDGGADDRWFFDYEAEDYQPPVFLARLFKPGGAWISTNEFSSTLRWVDVSFVLDDEARMTSVWLFRDNVVYSGRGAAFGPQRPPMGRVWNFPMPVPPPEDPMEGAWQVMP